MSLKFVSADCIYQFISACYKHANKISLYTKSVNFLESLIDMKFLTISEVVMEVSNTLAQHIYINDSDVQQYKPPLPPNLCSKLCWGMSGASRNWVHIRSGEIHTPTRWYPERHAACVTAQQHSSAIFVSLSIHPTKKNSVFQKYLISSSFKKLRNL